MNDTFRRRFFTPLVMPLTITGGILLFAYALSRVLLAVPESLSTVIAVAVAGYILLVASLAGQRRSITGRALGAGLLVGFAGLVVAGAVAGAAGIRELEHAPEDDHDAEAGGQVASAGAGARDVPEDAAVWESEEGIAFTSAPETMPSTTTMALVNTSGIPHNVVFEGFEGDRPLVEVQADGVDIQAVEVPAGTYTYYCSVAGHRQAGMEGEIAVEG